jgi:hypothetical protein
LQKARSFPSDSSPKAGFLNQSAPDGANFRNTSHKILPQLIEATLKRKMQKQSA